MNSNETRVYGSKVDINTNKTSRLFDKRAERTKDGDLNVYTSVLIGDQNPEYAKEWNRIEKELVLPQLDITGDTAIIDIGCGIGRWAETVLPICKNYIGVDFSEGMIASAKERLKEQLDENKIFVNASAQDFLRNFDASGYPPVGCFIISYVMMYINDSDIRDMFAKILSLADKKCSIYVLDTVALDERITLREIYSQAMKSDYSALYRTIEEYDAFFSVFEEAGFEKVSAGFMPKLNNEEHFKETDRHYCIFKR